VSAAASPGESEPERAPRVIAVRRGYALKRALDVALVAGTLPLWLPLLLAVAVLVRVRLGAPVLFRQQRPGRGGVPFELLKFRTMSDARDASGAPLADEARLTRFGRRLRSTSLDELPELLNVLRGDMSLVGPRPLLLRYMPRYSPRHLRRHELRPGLTGLAQISGRNAIDWATRFDVDVDYVDRCSLGLDLWILARTVRTVLRREGVSAAGEATMPEFTGYPAISSSATPASSRRSAQERQGPTDAGASSAVRTRAHTRA